MSSKKITIKDLCPEDKKKIGELLRKLSNETEEKERLKQMIEEDKKLYESKIKSMKDSFMQQPLEFKSESFAQSFIAEPVSTTANDIKQLRSKFDSVFNTLKKAVKTNETIVSKMNSEYSEEEPNKIKPIPIKQDNILQSSLMDESMPTINNNDDKSFISTNANEDILNGFDSISNKRTSPISNNKINNGYVSRFGKNSTNKYKEMLGRIREKSKNKDMFNNYKSEANTFAISTNTNNISISNELQIQFQANSRNNLSNDSGKKQKEFIPQNTNSINLNMLSTNSEKNDEFLSVVNLLSNTKSDTISKLNTSIRNDNIMSTSSTITNTSKLEEVVNDNVFNYILSLENKSKKKKDEQSKIKKENEFVNQIEEVEKEIENLSNLKYTKPPIQDEPPKEKKKTNKQKLYEEFKSINSNYL